MSETSVRLLMTTDAVGGVWQYATELAASLVPQGVSTVLAVLGPPPDPWQRGSAQAVPGLKLIDTGLPLDWLVDARQTRAASAGIAALSRRESVDLIHLNSPALAAEQGFELPVLAVAHGCPTTWWEATRPGQMLAPAFSWHRKAMALGLRACDRIVAPSASYAGTLRRLYRLPMAPHVVHNGRSPPAHACKAAPHDCALTAGRLWDDAKNIRTLDAAAALLTFPFHAAGAIVGPHGETLHTKNLHLLGQLDGPALMRRLASRPVFVSAAIFEPFGLAVLEAAGAGCPLVLSDIPTFRELWEGAAIFAAPDDAAGFAASIQECVWDQQLRESLGNAARERALSYSPERMANAMAAHYRDLLATRRAA